jgi:hypothetical protein
MNILKIVGFFCLLLTFAACKKEADVTPVPDISASFTAQKSGVFVGQNGYQSSGKVDLGTNEKTESIVRLNSDFQTMIATGSVAIYLSKNKNLTLNDANSFTKLGDINEVGARDFKLPSAPATDFTFVIAWCAPAGIQFGNAALK